MYLNLLRDVFYRPSFADACNDLDLERQSLRVLSAVLVNEPEFPRRGIASYAFHGDGLKLGS